MISCKQKNRNARIVANCAIAIVFFAAGGNFLADAQIFRGYHPGGSLSMKANTQGKKKIIKSYYANGALEAVYEYERGKLNGITRQYYQNGVLKSEIPYRFDKRHGNAKFFYPSGMLMARIEFVDDKEAGKSRLYDENGKLISGSTK